ncbi:MAG: family 78 glycoside hydrolase catalytic domain, partial [Victivallales bacterium]
PIECVGSDLKNVHTYFRKEITLDQAPVRAMLYITGDDTFKFYFNGRFFVQGPEPGYPFAQPYYAMPVTDQLKTGTNCLSVHIYYHGCYCRAFNSGDNRNGFLMVLDLTFADGSRIRHFSDPGWKCHRASTFSANPNHIMGYFTQFNENMDLRCEPIGWRETGFDDATWEAPLIRRQDHVFIPAIAAPLAHWHAEPAKIESRGEGVWFYDFGRELVGHTRIRLRGPSGHVIVVRHGEELNPDGSVRHEMRCNCKYEDEITLSGRDDVAEFYDYRGFRYMEIHNALAQPEVLVDVRHYPFDEAASDFDCSEPLLNGIWKMSKLGVQMGSQDVFTDCPTREKGQYTVDTYMTALSQLILTGDPALTRKAIRDIQLTQRFDPGLLTLGTGSFRQEIAEASLLWPVMLHYYYWMTGDKTFTVNMVNAGLERLLEWFFGMEDPNGLLTRLNGKKWIVVDWPANLRGGYDYETTKDGVNTVINAFYYGMLKCSAELVLLAGRDNTAIRLRIERLRTAFVGHLLDPATKLFRDGADSGHQSLHASGFALRFGLAPKKALPEIVQFMRQKRLDCGIYGAHYFIEGLFQSGQHELAYDLLTSHDDHSWAEMLRHGATTPLEAWAPDQKWNTSFCHPCGSTPIYLLVRYVMGLTPAAPGWKVVKASPQIPAKLERMRVRFPTVAGSIIAEYDKAKGYRLIVPRGVEVEANSAEWMPITVTYA